MDRKMQRNRYEQRRTKFLLAIAAVLLFSGLFAQIAVRAQVSGQAKEIAGIQQELYKMKAEAKNLDLCINQHHDLIAIDMRARELGFTQPTEDQLRVVNLPQINENTSTQTVANIGGEEMNG